LLIRIKVYDALISMMLKKNLSYSFLLNDAVYVAVTKGYLDIVNLLVDWGADLNIFIGNF